MRRPRASAVPPPIPSFPTRSTATADHLIRYTPAPAEESPLTTARRHVALFLAVALLGALAHGWRAKPWTPQGDEDQYLAYAHNLFHHGIFARTPAGPRADDFPGREPLWSLVLAGLMAVDGRLAAVPLDCIWNRDPACRDGYRIVAYANALLLGAGAVLVFATALALAAPPLAAWAGGLYVLLNFQAAKLVPLAMSDLLALALAAALALVLALATARRWPPALALAAGLVAALLALTKGLFLLLAIAVALLLALRIVPPGAVPRARRAAAAAGFALALALPLALWAGHNWYWFGKARLADERGAIALSTRAALNDMTAAEWAGAFVYWTRGIGDDLARRFLPPEAWRRLPLDAPGGFYEEGQLVQMEARREALRARGIHDRIALADAIGPAVAREILEDWPRWLATMPPVFWRGIWIDEFVVLGLPCLAFIAWRSARRRRWPVLAALAVGLFSLMAYAALSLNIPRYQATALPALALAAALAVAAWQARRAREAPP